ncbi:MAG: hypothetical protein Q7J45_04645 [bacterium]|nr:hypothetical protein [bacterium]
MLATSALKSEAFVGNINLGSYAFADQRFTASQTFAPEQREKLHGDPAAGLAGCPIENKKPFTPLPYFRFQ